MATLGKTTFVYLPLYHILLGSQTTRTIHNFGRTLKIGRASCVLGSIIKNPNHMNSVWIALNSIWISHEHHMNITWISHEYHMNVISIPMNILSKGPTDYILGKDFQSLAILKGQRHVSAAITVMCHSNFFIPNFTQILKSRRNGGNTMNIPNLKKIGKTEHLKCLQSAGRSNTINNKNHKKLVNFENSFTAPRTKKCREDHRSNHFGPEVRSCHRKLGVAPPLLGWMTEKKPLKLRKWMLGTSTPSSISGPPTPPRPVGINESSYILSLSAQGWYIFLSVETFSRQGLDSWNFAANLRNIPTSRNPISIHFLWWTHVLCPMIMIIIMII